LKPESSFANAGKYLEPNGSKTSIHEVVFVFYKFHFDNYLQNTIKGVPVNTFIPILKQADIFYDFSNEQLDLVAEICQERTLETGEVIFFEGSKSDELYIIADGVIDILVNPSLVSDNLDKNHEPVTIATLRRGQSFGEIALVDQGVRSATARTAHDNTRLLVVPSDKLMAVCEEYPQLGYRLMFNLAADLSLKIRSSSLRIREELLYGRI
jgi:CRP-like cAMP-binding protein